MLILINRLKEFRRKALLLVVATLLGSGFYQAAAYAALPTSAACSGAGTGTVTCNLWAKPGTATLTAGVTVPIWGYTSIGPLVDPLAQPGLPGPVLVVIQGDTVTVNLTNNLTTEPTALLFQGQSLPPDTVGASPGATKSYTFTASVPGTYLYEAGLLKNTQHQPAMGLYGALMVRPAGIFTAPAGQAYGATTAFDDEALVLVSEIDTALNSSVTPSLFDMRKFAPKYFLINGKAHPSPELVTLPDPVVTPYPASGFNLLLRYVNAGVKHHSMALLGLRQQFIANDGSLLLHPRNGVSETIAPGQTVDAITTVPVTAVSGSKFALYDAGMSLNNSDSPGMGGMLNFVALAGTPPVPGTPPKSPGVPADTVGPVTSGVAMTPNPSNGVAAVTLTATGNDTTTGNSNIASASYSIAGGPANQAMTLVGAPAPVLGLTATIPAGTITGLSEGPHAVTVTSTDALFNLGAASAPVDLIVDRTGPTVATVVATPNPTNGVIGVNSSTSAVRVLASLSDVTTTVAAGELFIDTVGAVGSGVVLVPSDGSFNSATETGYTDIPLGTVRALSDGNHTLSVRGRDAAGNWSGVLGTTMLVVDKVVPTISAITLTPATITVATASVTLNITADGTGTVIAGGDYWFDDTTPPATATVFTGNTPSISTAALTVGPHNVRVRVKDAAGNVSTVTSLRFTVAPVAMPDSYSGVATQSNVQVAAPGVLGNDLPVGGTRSAAYVTGTLRRNGTTTLSGATLRCTSTGATTGICTNGAFRLNLPGTVADRVGTYTFQYRATINGVQSAPATVTITVN